MNANDAEEYTQSLGQIFSGSWRQLAWAHRMGVHKALDYKDFKKYVEDRIGGYIKMSLSEKKEAIAELAAEGFSIREIADITGDGKSTIHRELVPNGTLAEKNPNNSGGDFDATVPFGTVIDAEPQAMKSRREGEQERKAILDASIDPDLITGLHIGDFRSIAHRIKDESVDLIFTDPPYDKDAVDLYRDAASVARRILKPGASFIAYSGLRHLPEVLSACNQYLDYWWTIACVHGGGNQILQRLGIRAGWKPLVWFVKGTRGDIQNILVDVVTGDREKDIHEWQQAESEASYYIEKLTPADGLVVDFFVGGGTTLVAAKKLGRRSIGFEIDQKSAEKAAERLAA